VKSLPKGEGCTVKVKIYLKVPVSVTAISIPIGFVDGQRSRHGGAGQSHWLKPLA
jgi:hypothetical protein